MVPSLRTPRHSLRVIVLSVPRFSARLATLLHNSSPQRRASAIFGPMTTLSRVNEFKSGPFLKGSAHMRVEIVFARDNASTSIQRMSGPASIALAPRP